MSGVEIDHVEGLAGSGKGLGALKTIPADRVDLPLQPRMKAIGEEVLVHVVHPIFRMSPRHPVFYAVAIPMIDADDTLDKRKAGQEPGTGAQPTAHFADGAGPKTQQQ